MSGFTVAVVAAGEVDTNADGWVTQLQRCDLVIAADGGLVHCAAVGVWPDHLVGDLDSAPVDLVAQARANGAKIEVHPVDKHETDLELAMAAAADRGATEIVVVAMFGGWVDHQVANIAVVAGDRWAPIRVSAHDGIRSMWVVRDAVELDQPVGATLSLLPWGGPTHGVTASGVAWPLVGETLAPDRARGVSNVCAEPNQSVAVDAGTLLVIATGR